MLVGRDLILIKLKGEQTLVLVKGNKPKIIRDIKLNTVFTSFIQRINSEEDEDLKKALILSCDILKSYIYEDRQEPMDYTVASNFILVESEIFFLNITDKNEIILISKIINMNSLEDINRLFEIMSSTLEKNPKTFLSLVLKDMGDKK